MKFGYMYDFRATDRFPIPRPRLYEEGFEHMRAAESLGFASVWTPEHHLSDCGYNPRASSRTGGDGRPDVARDHRHQRSAASVPPIR